MRKWKSLVSISKARVYAPSFASPYGPENLLRLPFSEEQPLDHLQPPNFIGQMWATRPPTFQKRTVIWSLTVEPSSSWPMTCTT